MMYISLKIYVGFQLHTLWSSLTQPDKGVIPVPKNLACTAELILPTLQLEHR